MDFKRAIQIDYTNWRGERSVRNIIPHKLVFESNKFHPEPQWLLDAYDLDKKENRRFALSHIHQSQELHERRILDRIVICGKCFYERLDISIIVPRCKNCNSDSLIEAIHLYNAFGKDWREEFRKRMSDSFLKRAWIPLFKGSREKSCEVSVVRLNNFGGIRSWGWNEPDSKIILYSTSNGEAPLPTTTYQCLVNAAKSFADSLNGVDEFFAV